MPGNSKRPGPVRGTRPPTYVSVPTPLAYASVPDALIVTMIRILGLCWTNRHRHTPPLTFEELVHLLDRPRSTLQRHLDILEQDLGWLRRERQDRRFTLYPRPPFSSAHRGSESLQDLESSSFAAAKLPGTGLDPVHVAGGPDTVENCSSASAELGGTGPCPVHDGLRPSHVAGGPDTVESCSSASAELPGTGLDPVHVSGDTHPWSKTLATRQDLLQALADVGIENPARERIALDPAVKADWIPAWQLWAEHPARANLSNLPGYIVRCLRSRARPPEHYLRLVRLTPAEEAQLRRSRWDGGDELDPHLRAIRSLYFQHFMDRNRR